MLIGELKRGAEVTIEVISRAGKVLQFKTAVEVVVDKFQVLLSPIYYKKKALSFGSYPVNIVVAFPSSDKNKPVTYNWKFVNVRLVKWKGHKYHTVRTENESELYNRRRAKRINVGGDVIINESTKGSLENISFTGVLFRCKSFNYNSRDVLRLQITINGYRTCALSADLIRVDKREECVLVACQFRYEHVGLNSIIAKIDRGRARTRGKAGPYEPLQNPRYRVKLPAAPDGEKNA